MDNCNKKLLLATSVIFGFMFLYALYTHTLKLACVFLLLSISFYVIYIMQNKLENCELKCK